MTDYKLTQKSIVDELAQFIRQVDGNHKMGAGSLADKICERFRVDAPAVQGEPVAWLAGEVCGGDASHNTVNVALDNPAPWSALPIGAKVAIQSPQPAEQQPTCPTCRGGGWDIDYQNRFRLVTCPDCAGSGKFEHSITAQESDSAAPDVDVLVEALEEAYGTLERAVSPADETPEAAIQSAMFVIDAALAAHHIKENGNE